MTCPYCEYKTGWDADKLEVIDGGSGDLYELPIKARRNPGYSHAEEVRVLACPACKKVFID